jgi:2-iminobutanoate/2-iminopropanoate deaminase
MGAKREVVRWPVRALDAVTSPRQGVSMAVRGGDFVFVSGLAAVDPQSGEPMRGTTAGETRQILTDLVQLLEAAGSSLDKVVKVNVLLASMLEAPNMNEVYARFFPDAPPARTVCGARLPDGVKVMIECTALA